MNGGQSVVIIFVIKGGIAGIRAIVAHALHRHLDLLELDPKLKSWTSGLLGVGKADNVPAELITDHLADVETHSDAFWI